MNTVLSVFGGVASFGMHLGIVRLFWVAVVVVVGILVFKMLNQVQSTLDWCGRHWRKAPTWRKQVYGFFGAVVAWKVLWPILPKTTAALAVALGVGVVFYAQGYQYARKYGLVGTHAMAAWRHHWQVTRMARKHTAAIPDGTGKKGGRARKPTPTADGADFIVHPPHGMSDTETADTYNDGKMNSALADRLGLDAVQDVTATPVGDGTVKVSVLHAQTKDNFFDASHAWPGMEKP